MATLEVSFFSHCLQRNVSFSAIVPIEDKLSTEKSTGFKTLYLLHGLGGNHKDWLANTMLAIWARGRNLAIIMPSAENKAYVDNVHTKERFGEFIGVELVEFTRALFSLSNKREDTFIGGLSMGGYGAMRNGLKYHETFGSIISLSGALAVEFLPFSNEDDPRPNRRRSFLEGVFGNLDAVAGSDMDSKALAKALLDKGAKFPEIYIACGTEDELLPQNRLYHNFFNEHNITHKYIEDAGGHEWPFWDKYIKKSLDWLNHGIDK